MLHYLHYFHNTPRTFVTMKLYEICFDYKLDATDVIHMYVGENWEIELKNFKKQILWNNLVNTICF